MSVFGPDKESRETFISLQSVIGQGPVSAEMRDGHPYYHLYGRHRDRPIHILVLTDEDGPLAIHFGITLGGRPITLLLNHRRNTVIHAVPEVRTGDPQFDGVFLLNGFPATVLAEALDRPTRVWLLEQYGSREPSLQTEGGELTLGVVVQSGTPSNVRVMFASEVEFWLDHLISIAEQLVSSFERQRAELVRTQGAAAAERWISEHRGAMAARASRRKNIRRALYTVLFGLPIGGALVFAAAMIGWAVFSLRKPPPVAALDLMREGATASFDARAGQRITFRTDVGLTDKLMSDENESQTRENLKASSIQVTVIEPGGSESTQSCPPDALGVMKSDRWDDQGNGCAFDVVKSGTHRLRAKVVWRNLSPRSGTLKVVVSAP